MSLRIVSAGALLTLSMLVGCGSDDNKASDSATTSNDNSNTSGDEQDSGEQDSGDNEEDSGDDEEDSGGEEDTGLTGGFIGDVTSTSTCDTFAQDCPDGERCVPVGEPSGGTWTTTACQPVADTPKEEGDECQFATEVLNGDDDCDVGFMCIGAYEEEPGVCTKLCEGSPSAPDCGNRDAICGGDLLSVCWPRCDPREKEAACPPVHACLPETSDGFVCSTGRRPSGQHQIGEACEYRNYCVPGSLCIGAENLENCESGSCCAAVCDTDGAADQCSAPEVCVPYYEDSPPPGLNTLGICQLPL